ncbi:hypothetical protein EBZ39_08955 [bacterium]|nr:hypothetical protein [bacterium]
MIKATPGSIVLYALLILSAVVFLMQGMIRGVFLNNQSTSIALARQQAEQLAWAGVQCAIVQLTVGSEADELDEDSKGAANASGDEKKQDPAAQQKAMLKRVLPHLGRWQTFTLRKKHDLLDGEIKFCVVSEHGKLNINRIFDFQKMEFKKPYSDLVAGLEVPPLLKRGELLERLVEFFKKRKKPLYDVSELLTVPGLQTLEIFYVPPPAPEKGKPAVANQSVALLDLFTVWTDQELVSPLWLSDGLRCILGLRRPHADDAEKQQEAFKKTLHLLKPEAGQDWDANWQVLEPVYGPKPKAITALKNNFAKEFGSTVYSVLSCGKVDEVECQLLVILKEQNVGKKAAKTSPEKMADKAKSDPDDQPKKVLRPIRVYWL